MAIVGTLSYWGMVFPVLKLDKLTKLLLHKPLSGLSFPLLCSCPLLNPRPTRTLPNLTPCLIHVQKMAVSLLKGLQGKRVRVTMISITKVERLRAGFHGVLTINLNKTQTSSQFYWVKILIPKSNDFWPRSIHTHTAFVQSSPMTMWRTSCHVLKTTLTTLGSNLTEELMVNSEVPHMWMHNLINHSAMNASRGSTDII